MLHETLPLTLSMPYPLCPILGKVGLHADLSPLCARNQEFCRRFSSLKKQRLANVINQGQNKGENQHGEGARQHTIAFEDHSQDFLEWDVKDGVVVACRPFQEWAWKGTKVDMTKAQESQLWPIITLSGATKVIQYLVSAMSRTEA